MRWTLRAPRLHAALAAVAITLAAAPAVAAGDDAAVSSAVQTIMNEEYPGNLGPAKKKLQEQLSNCLKKGCSGPVKAQVYISLGMVNSQLGQADEAKSSFQNPRLPVM